METNIETFVPSFSDAALKKEITKEYSEVACNKDHTIHFVSGEPLARRLGYPDPVFAYMPSEALRPFAGVGNPHKIKAMKPHESVLDIGSGGGFDLLTAWLSGQKLAPLYGIDITDAMLDKAKENAAALGASNVVLQKGFAEDIPLPDASVDVVISNGVINLCTDKLQVYREIHRVLKPGGRFQIADIILENPVPNESREHLHLWVNCVAGGIPLEEYKEILHAAGFDQIDIGQRYDVFRDARVEKSARHFGAVGVNILGYK